MADGQRGGHVRLCGQHDGAVMRALRAHHCGLAHTPHPTLHMSWTRMVGDRAAFACMERSADRSDQMEDGACGCGDNGTRSHPSQRRVTSRRRGRTAEAVAGHTRLAAGGHTGRSHTRSTGVYRGHRCQRRATGVGLRDQRVSGAPNGLAIAQHAEGCAWTCATGGGDIAGHRGAGGATCGVVATASHEGCWCCARWRCTAGGG